MKNKSTSRVSLPGQDNHLAGDTLADALSSNIRVVSQSNMDNAPFISRHRFQTNRCAVRPYLIGKVKGQGLQGLIAAPFIVLDINNQGWPDLGRVLAWSHVNLRVCHCS